MSACLLEGQNFNWTNQQCINCIDNCRSCDNLQCYECKIGFYLDSNYECIEKCPKEYYLDYSTNKCLRCQDLNCQQCTSSECKLCKEGFELNENKICVDILCKYANGNYIQETKKCSLDSYFLDESQKFGLNQYKNNLEMPVINQSQYAEERYEDIQEINIYNIYGVFKLVATSNQFITIYDCQSMTILKFLDIQGCIYQTIFKNNSLLILVALNLSNKNDIHENILLQLVQVNLMTHVKQTIKLNYDDNLIDAILTQKKLFLKYNNYVTIYDLNDKTSHQLMMQDKIKSISFLEIEEILLIETEVKEYNNETKIEIHFTNQLFTMTYKIQLSNSYHNIGKIISMSLISTILEQNQLIFYSVIKNGKDQIQQFVIGKVI